MASSGFKDGKHQLRPFQAKDFATISSLPGMTASDWMSLAQWTLLALQDGEGVLTVKATEVLLYPDVMMAVCPLT